MRMQHPALAAAVDVTCLDLDLGEPTAEAVDEFERILTTRPPTLVVVAFEDESLAWSSGLFVRNRADVARRRSSSAPNPTAGSPASSTARCRPIRSRAVARRPVDVSRPDQDGVARPHRRRRPRADRPGAPRRPPAAHRHRRRAPRAVDPDDRRRQGIEPCRCRRDRRDAGHDRLPAGPAAPVGWLPRWSSPTPRSISSPASNTNAGAPSGSAAGWSVRAAP